MSQRNLNPYLTLKEMLKKSPKKKLNEARQARIQIQADPTNEGVGAAIKEALAENNIASSEPQPKASLGAWVVEVSPEQVQLAKTALEDAGFKDSNVVDAGEEDKETEDGNSAGSVVSLPMQAKQAGM